MPGEMVLEHYLSCIIERVELSIGVNLVLTLFTPDINLPHTLFRRYTRITVLQGNLVRDARMCVRLFEYIRKFAIALTATSILRRINIDFSNFLIGRWPPFAIESGDRFIKVFERLFSGSAL